MMFRGFRQRFLEPRGKTWFGMGLVIESAPAGLAERALRKLRAVFPGVAFNLLTSARRPRAGFIHTIRVRHALGGLRLLWRARRHYDLLVLFATGSTRLRLCRLFALLLMRPRRVFVFNEFGEGFWLHRESSGVIAAHIERRYDLRARWAACCRAWARFVVRPCAWLAFQVRTAAYALGSLGAWLGDKLARAAWLAWGTVLFLFALVCLGVLRLAYDTRTYHFRFFGKIASAPRRELRRATSTLLPHADRR